MSPADAAIPGSFRGPRTDTATRHITIQNDAGPPPAGRAGSVFSVVPLRREADGSYLFSRAGRLFSARSELELSLGVPVRVRSEGGPDGLLVLRLVDGGKGPAGGDVAEALLSRLGLSPDPARLAVVSALAELGRPLDAATVERLARRATTRPGRPEEAARVLAVAWDKGLLLSEDAVSAILGEGGDGGNGGGRPSPEDRGRQDRGDEEGRRPALPDGTGAAAAGTEDSVDQDSSGRSCGDAPAIDGRRSGLDAESFASLAAAIRRSLVAASSSDGALALFNGSAGQDGRRWIVIPFSFSLSDVALHCDLRILCTLREGSAPMAERMEATVTAPGGRYSFIFAGEGLSSCSVSRDPELSRVEFEIATRVASVGGSGTFRPAPAGGSVPFSAVPIPQAPVDLEA